MFNAGTHCHWMYVFRIFVTGMRQGGGVAGSQRTGSSAQHNSLIREGVIFFSSWKLTNFLIDLADDILIIYAKKL